MFALVVQTYLVQTLLLTNVTSCFNDMSIRNTDTKVYLYLNDYNAVCGEIYRHQRIETGGNLFGLWTTEGNVVVHVPLGPGENCKRTDVSFHQDVAYLSRVGSFLNKFMLCHIGKWHSHHRLSLNEPSSGDKRTIRDNYPNGVKKFLVIIGNIVGRDQVILSPYFFSKNGNTYEKGILEVLYTDSTFTTDATIIREMNEGAESPRQPIQNLSLVTASRQQATLADPSRANDDSQQIAMDVCSNSDNPTPKSGSGSASADKSPTYSIPPPDYGKRPTTPKSPSEPPTKTATPQNSAQPSASCNPPIANSSSGSEGDDGNKQTRKEVIMKKVFDEIKSRFEDSGVVIEGVMSGLIEMKFKHNNKHWFLKFPQSFPEKLAEMFTSHSGKFSDATKITSSACKFLNNYFDIFLLIKNECNSWNCSPCKRINVERLRQSDPTLDLFLTEEGNAMIKDLWDKAKETLTDTRSLEKKMKSDDVWNNAILEVSFTHSSKQWIIAVRSTFPAERSAAKLYYKDESRIVGGFRSFVCYENGQDSSKYWVSEVLFAITNCCRCVDCKRLKFT